MKTFIRIFATTLGLVLPLTAPGLTPYQAVAAPIRMTGKPLFSLPSALRAPIPAAASVPAANAFPDGVRDGSLPLTAATQALPQISPSPDSPRARVQASLQDGVAAIESSSDPLDRFSGLNRLFDSNVKAPGLLGSYDMLGVFSQLQDAGAVEDETRQKIVRSVYGSLAGMGLLKGSERGEALRRRMQEMEKHDKAYERAYEEWGFETEDWLDRLLPDLGSKWVDYLAKHAISVLVPSSLFVSTKAVWETWQAAGVTLFTDKFGGPRPSQETLDQILLDLEKYQLRRRVKELAVRGPADPKNANATMLRDGVVLMDEALLVRPASAARAVLHEIVESRLFFERFHRNGEPLTPALISEIHEAAVQALGSPKTALPKLYARVQEWISARPVPAPQIVRATKAEKISKENINEAEAERIVDELFGGIGFTGFRNDVEPASRVAVVAATPQQLKLIRGKLEKVFEEKKLQQRQSLLKRFGQKELDALSKTWRPQMTKAGKVAYDAALAAAETSLKALVEQDSERLQELERKRDWLQRVYGRGVGGDPPALASRRKAFDQERGDALKRTMSLSGSRLAKIWESLKNSELDNIRFMTLRDYEKLTEAQRSGFGLHLVSLVYDVPDAFSAIPGQMAEVKYWPKDGGMEQILKFFVPEIFKVLWTRDQAEKDHFSMNQFIANRAEGHNHLSLRLENLDLRDFRLVVGSRGWQQAQFQLEPTSWTADHFRGFSALAGQEKVRIFGNVGAVLLAAGQADLVPGLLNALGAKPSS